MNKIVGILAALAFGMFFIPAVSAVVPTYNTDFTCAQLVELNKINESSISHGTVYLPIGYIQVDGCLFDTSEQHPTGTFYGEAYNTTKHETGTFYGSGF